MPLTTTRRTRRQRALDRWAHQAATATAQHTNLDSTMLDTLTRALTENFTDGAPNTFEFIVDHPSAANWRIKADHGTGGLRLADYRLYDAPWPAWAATLNQKFQQLGAPPSR